MLLHKTPKQTPKRRIVALTTGFVLAIGVSWAQEAPPVSSEQDEEVLVLSPFEVSADEVSGYTAATTLAGNRLNTELRDVGNAVTVVTSQFLKDIQATNNETLLQYTAGTEVGNVRGNFAGLGDGQVLDEATTFDRPNQNTRVRGLASADNTRDYFLTDIPWDAYNVDRVDLQRGPNSILFGLGSPAGLLNVGTKQAGFRDTNEIQIRADNWGSLRGQVNINKVIIPRELAIRLDTVQERQKFQQDPAYEDNARTYGAFRWEPGFLKKASARTILKASFENGNIESNRPRTLPPLDRITPWFYTGTYTGSYKATGSVRDANGQVQQVTLGSPRVYNNLNRETFNPFQLQDDNTGRANHGQMRPAINGGADSGFINNAFNPWIGNFGNQFGGPNAFYADANASTPASNFVWEGSNVRGIGTNGEIDGDIGRSFHRPGGIASYDMFAQNAGLPYYQSGLYKAASLSDASVFDFYNNLLDGPNKWEWNDWNVYNVSLAQTFMDDKFGFEVNYQSEDFRRGTVALLSSDRQAIFIDINNVYSDGTPEGLNGEPFQDGTPNPNLGRPFITDSGSGGNNSYESEHDALRATGFFTHDFSRKQNSLWRRILGQHTFTGLYSEDEQTTDQRGWQRYAIQDPAYAALVGASAGRFGDNQFRVNRVIYLGESLAGRSSASGANIPRPNAVADVTSPMNVRVWDSTWTATGVDPAAPWENVYYPNVPPFNTPDDPATAANERGAYFNDQANNPNNYRGFINTTANVVDSWESQANRDLLTTGAQLTKSKVASKAFVWQGKFWDGSIVGTFGYRKDSAKSWGTQLNSATTPAPGHLDLSPANYRLPDMPDNVVDVQSRSYSIVAHLNELPFVSNFAKELPVQLSFFYNKSDNFQPSAARVDVYGERLSPPAGKTIDRGILIESRDGRYSLKINKFITTLTDASSSALSHPFFIGNSQAWAANWANRFEYDYTTTDNNLMNINYQANNRPAGAANPPGYSPTFRPGNPDFDATNSLYNYGTDVGETAEQAAAREARAVAGWRAWQQSVDPRFYAAWGIDLNDYENIVTASTPQGFTVTEDSVSSGYEIEFNANPTRNWRVALNATKVEATRSNVGGTNLREFITAYEKALRDTPAGDLRIWWGGAGNATTLVQWYQDADNQVGSDWAQKALGEGTKVSELRKWRFNAITNYTFSEGVLKGFNVGGGVRWQDRVAIGNRPVGDPYSQDISFDLDNPYYGSEETSYDAWIGYTRKLSRKLMGQTVEWNIQLNVTNLGQGNELIPVTVQPDGTPATYRIAPHEYWTLTNSLRF